MLFPRITNFAKVKCQSPTVFGLSSVMLFLFLCGCQWSSSEKNHVLIVAVDRLGFQDLHCNQDETQGSSGFQFLCQQATRFTHAYTPSLQSRSALASVLTGLYPFQHLVRDHKSHFLKASEFTVAEGFSELGYRTSFFTSGPPIFRTSGLQQGFEVFDESFRPTLQRQFLPVEKILSQYWQWRKENWGDNTFSVIYLSDLNHPEVATKNELGEIRNLTIDSQLETISLSLGNLMTDLQKTSSWKKTDLILMGLQGRNSAGQNSIPWLDLRSSMSHITLLWKKSSDTALPALDSMSNENFSLVDVGSTLAKMAGQKKEAARENPVDQRFKIISLTDPAEREQNEKRWILTESAWGRSRLGSALLFSVRAQDQVYIQGTLETFFNTLTDLSETVPVPENDLSIQLFRNQVAQWLADWQTPFLAPVRQNAFNPVLARAFNFEVWNFFSAAKKADFLTSLKSNLPLIRHMQEYYLLQSKKWEWLAKHHSGELRQLAFLFVRPNHNARFASACLNLFFQRPRLSEVKKLCDEKNIWSLAAFLASQEEPSPRNGLYRQLVKNFYFASLDRRILENNWGLGLPLDPNIAEKNLVSNFEIILSLPQNLKLRQSLDRDAASLE